MLRLFYKTLLISVLSGSLSIMNMTAFAQSTSGSSPSMGKAQVPSGYSRDANGVMKKTDNLNLHKIDDMDLIASVTMLATGFIAARLLLKYKPVTMDMMIAASAGAAFIAGEIMSNVAYKKKIEDMSAEITRSSDGKKDQAQIDRLSDLRQSYEEAKKTTGTKKMLQLAAAALFAGAAATAGYLNYQEYAAFNTCQSAVVAAKSCGAPALSLANLIPMLNAARMKPGPTQVNSVSVNSIKASIELDLGLLPAACASTSTATAGASVAAGTTAITACKAAIAIETINQTVRMNPVNAAETMVLNQSIKNLFPGNNDYKVVQGFHPASLAPSNKIMSKILELIFPRAEAGWLPLLGLTSGALVATFGAAYLGLAVETDFFMLSPFNRVIAWGSLAALSMLAANSSENQIGKIDDNIAKIDKVLSDMNAYQNGIRTNETQVKLSRISGFNPANQTAIQINPDVKVKTDCIASPGNTNCKPLSDQIKSMPGFAELPDSFKSIATQSAKLGDGLSGTNTISGSTLGTAANLANQSHAIAKLQKNVQSKLNDVMGASGNKIDFEKEQNNLIKKWNDSTEKALNSKGMSPGQFLASTGISPLSSSTPKPLAPTPTASKGAALPSAVGSAPAVKKDKGFDLDFKEAGEANMAAIGEGTASKEEKYDIGDNDINTNSGESIFQMISNRYIKSGYPKLLEEIPVKN